MTFIHSDAVDSFDRYCLFFFLIKSRHFMFAVVVLVWRVDVFDGLDDTDYFYGFFDGFDEFKMF